MPTYVLITRVLTATVIALALQVYFGRTAFLAALGQALAIVGAVVFALWPLKQSNGRP